MQCLMYSSFYLTQTFSFFSFFPFFLQKSEEITIYSTVQQNAYSICQLSGTKWHKDIGTRLSA